MSITLFIILFTVLISVTAFRNVELFDKLKLNSYMVAKKKEYYRMVSHTFLHADWMHLIFNMITMYFFGEYAELQIKANFGAGSVLFVGLYLFGGVVATLPSVIKHKNDHWYNSVGASGAVAAVLFTSILFDPWMGIQFYFIPIPIPGFIFGVAYLVYSQYMSSKSRDNINHDAHFAGAVFGFIFPVILKPTLIHTFIINLTGGY
ncbi:MAG: rhomboid family intramembrane serine protease [Bacteroidales bacterium]